MNASIEHRAAAAIRVIEPGMLTTVQDLGRVGHRSDAVVTGGAADRLALRLGNRLLGNVESAAALELTHTGCTLEALTAIRVLIAGECDVSVETRGTRSARSCWRVIDLGARDSLIVAAMRRGARACVCIGGGIDVPPILGSRSTHLAAGFGGLAGRALRRGDELVIGDHNATPSDESNCEPARALHESVAFRTTLRCIDSAHTDDFGPEAIQALYACEFAVSNQSDRRGVRLVGSIVARAGDGTLPSEGMMPGAIQIPPSGEPIILGVDHPATGGYPLIACVIEADHAAIAQLRPRDRVRFQRVAIDGARNATRELEAQIRRFGM
ncbi:MAG: biotin-dependent carboxyltransferase family protein [Phycisphaerae bacterium]